MATREVAIRVSAGQFCKARPLVPQRPPGSNPWFRNQGRVASSD